MAAVSDIATDLIRLATKLEFSSDLPLDRLCFLVDEDEQKELIDWFNSTTRWANKDATPIDVNAPFFIRRIEVRRK